MLEGDGAEETEKEQEKLGKREQDSAYSCGKGRRKGPHSTSPSLRPAGRIEVRLKMRF